MRKVLIVMIAIGGLLPATAFAQGSGISGVVTDATGGVLPGVGVEVTSPALIEGSRSAVTDERGRYAFVELRPGTYTVIFTLTGFSTVRREGIDLPASFVANITAQLKVGSLEETITVSGAAPVVDVQSVVQQRLVPKDVIDAVPTGKSWSQLGVLTVGVSSSLADVGGSAGEQQNPLAAHGGASGDKIIEMDGMRLGLLLGTTSSTGVSSNDASTQEVSIEVGAISAETGGGGVRVNVIPKEGGNTFHGSGFAQFANKSMSFDNFSSRTDLKALGVLAPDRVNRIYDYSASLGGPLKRDKLWFFSAQRAWGYQNLRADAFYELNPVDYLYQPDPSRQAFDDQILRSHNLRLTWQMTPKNKLSVFYDYQPRCTCHWTVSSARPGEATPVQNLPLNWYGTVSYTSTLSNKLLLTIGFSNLSTTWTRLPQDDGVPIDPATGRLTSEGYGVNDSGLGITYRAYGAPFNYNYSDTRNWRGTLNYVTGSHQMKFGAVLLDGEQIVRNWMTDGDIRLNFVNTRPNSITKYSTPYALKNNLVADLGVYAQDAWTIKRLTLNLGLRFDYMNQMVPAQEAPAGSWVASRSWEPVRNVPNWKDLGPRLGVSYNLFGTGKTALKASLSRYVEQSATAFASANNPITTTRSNVTQAWSDLNGDYIPQANELSGPDLPGPLGARLPQTTYDDGVRTGFGVRRNNWEFSTGVSHELMRRVGTDVTYFRRSQGNFTSTDNRLVTPADYQEFCVTAPGDPRLPNPGERICGLFDLVPTKAGQTDNIVAFSDAAAAHTEVWQGVDVSVNARLGERMFMQGGFSTGSTAINDCGIVDSPDVRFCATNTPYLTQFKFIGAYTFPFDIQASAALQSNPGRQITASWSATNAAISPSLGRNLAGSTSYAIALVEPGTMYGDRVNQLDLRFSKILKVTGSKRLRLMTDLYNALNVSPVVSGNNTHNGTVTGGNWLKPTQILVGRFLKVGAQIDF